MDSAVAAAFARRRKAGCVRVATRRTVFGGSRVVARSGRSNGRRRVYRNPLTKRASNASAGTPSSAKARRIPSAMPPSISHWTMGVAPPGKWERSSAHCPGPGATKSSVMPLRSV